MDFSRLLCLRCSEGSLFQLVGTCLFKFLLSIQDWGNDMCVGERGGGEIDEKDEKTRSKQNVVKGKKLQHFLASLAISWLKPQN